MMNITLRPFHVGCFSYFHFREQFWTKSSNMLVLIDERWTGVNNCEKRKILNVYVDNWGFRRDRTACKWETNSLFKAKLIVLYFTKIIPSFHNFPPIMSKWNILCSKTFVKNIVPKIFPFQKTIMKKILEQACID